MQTPMLTPATIRRSWHLVDAEGKTLGRLATRIAGVLQGKHRPDYTPNQDSGDFVVVVNAEKVHLTGNKWAGKIYYRHSQYPGGLRERTAAQVRDAHPTRIIEAAVRGMLPGNRLRARRLKRLRIFAGPSHEHASQQPKPLKGV
ncbi:MAG: 50S ribosomal protein L13 [Candidatus Eremiobacteraeota bacterium]|nr:50S ribosomal protein L13 [Candidatus Eremiobacteraeota bacterium]MBC5827241.1 50S ribosomal protein L13 [Candidatus Eremiobacteraeota bacterium]